MVIVDTTVWIDYLGGVLNAESNWLDREVNRQRLGLTDLILCEVLQGIRDDVSFGRVLRDLRRFELFETGGAGLAIAAARNFRSLRRQGYTVRKTIDCWIATFCIQERHALLHRDRDFDPFESLLGLSVIRP
ncbi:MAG TPA: PIN domain nuclease [Candidatus Acidoferrales bacterium]|nr:PIN domain nuclease [Candidatus Acidoferrales bacterium]